MGSALESFGCLDGLIQIIYQSVHRFVLLSSITENEWTVHLGLSGSEGRWWRGVWKEKDVFETIGSISKATGKLLEGFAQKLADCLVNGDIFISNWSTAPGAEIKLTFSPSGKKPVHIPLTEISTAEAASFSTRVFLDIAIQAKSRKNQLHGGYEMPTLSLAGSSTFSTSTTEIDNDQSPASSSVKASEKSKAPERKSPVKVVEKSSKSSKRKESEPPGAPSQSKSTRALKGASLANPNKKARKFKAQEFESDED